MTNKEWSLKKKIIVGVLVAVVIFALVIGVVYVAVYSNMGKATVIPVSDIVYMDYDSDDFSMQGTISTGITQDVTSEQGKVTQILVNEGDYVKKGTALVRFDTTAAQLELEQAKLDLQSKQVDLNNAKAKLDMLNGAQSYVETIKVPVTSQDESDETSDSSDKTSEENSDNDSSSSDSSSASESGETTTSTSSGDSEKSDSSSDSEKSDSSSDSKEVEYQEVVVESDEPQFQTSDGTVYTETELRKEKSATNAEIVSLQTDIKEAEVTIEAAQKTLEACTVKATLDGYVTKVSQTALQDDEESETVVSEDVEEEDEDVEVNEDAVSSVPQDSSIEDDGIVVQVSSMDGLYVNSVMSEWRMEKYDVGDVVYVMDWESGNTFEATITTISPYASEESAETYQYMGGSAESYYPFTAQITQDGSGLSSGDYVDVSFSKPMDSMEDEMTESDILSVMKAFVRTENGKKYVYIRDENNKLKKQEVKVSSQSQETYTIESGLTIDDYVAFPYGKNIREGVDTTEGSIDDLYE